MKTKIHWGIIGLGRIAHKFAQDLRFVPNAKLHAVAASDSGRAKTFAEQYGVEYAFGSYEAILNCPHLDVVYIATPHPAHCTVTLMCLRRRIAVLCEKPFAMNATEVRLMIETAKAHQTFLMEAMWTRFIPTIHKTLELVEKEAIGTPLSIRADFAGIFKGDPNGRIFKRDLGAGALLDIGLYPVALTYFLWGKPDKIQAFAKLTDEAVDETCVINFQYQHGGIAHLYTSFVTQGHVEATIGGSRGRLIIHPPFHHSQNLSLDIHLDRCETINLPFEGLGYHFEAAHVNQCLQNNLLESPVWSLTNSLELIEILDAIRREIGLVYPKHD